jgi:aspartate/glutamate racemase
MKTIGLAGGIGPESTIDYYRAVMAAYRERQKELCVDLPIPRSTRRYGHDPNPKA